MGRTNQPHPPAPQHAGRDFFEPSLKLREVSEIRPDRLRYRTAWQVILSRPQCAEVNFMVQVTTRVMSHRIPNRLWHSRQVNDQLLNTVPPKLGMEAHDPVKLAQIGGVIMPVMNQHRLSVDMRFQRGTRIREWRDPAFHAGLLLRVG